MAVSGSFANGQPVWEAFVRSTPSAEDGEFVTLPGSAYACGDIIDVNVCGFGKHVGVITRVTSGSSEMRVWWESPLSIRGRSSVWWGKSADEIIDMFARDMALRFPA